MSSVNSALTFCNLKQHHSKTKRQRIQFCFLFFSACVCVCCPWLIKCFVVIHSETPRNLVTFLSSGKGLHKLLSSLMKNTEDGRAGSRHWVLDKVICLHCDSTVRHRGRQGQGRMKKENEALTLVKLMSFHIVVQR